MLRFEPGSKPRVDVRLGVANQKQPKNQMHDFFPFNQTNAMRAAQRTRLANSLFSTTFVISVLTVAAGQLLPCPVPNTVGADTAATEKANQDKKVVIASRQ